MSIADAEARFNDKLAERYFRIWETQPIQIFTRKVEALWIKALVRKGESVLFAGSGAGRELEAVLGTAGRIVAMDVSPGMLAAGRKHYAGKPIEWVLGDMQEPPPSLGRFDRVFVLAALTYVAEPRSAVTRLAGMLNSGGTLTVSMPNAEHPSSHSGEKLTDDGRLHRPLSENALRDLLVTAQLDLTELRGFRFFVDRLPKAWNRSNRPEAGFGGALTAVLDIEWQLLERLPARDGEHLWITGRRP
jgi:protein-L-isoaspartate O-methyltransferase